MSQTNSKSQAACGRTIIKNGLVLPFNRAKSPPVRADVLIENGVIQEVSANIEASDCVEIDATDCIVMPGLTDTHRHVWQTQLRGVATNWSLFDYVCNIRTRLGAAYTAEDVYIGNYVGALEALNAGITTIVDHSHITISPEHSEAAVRGLLDSGIRGVWCYGAYRNPEITEDGPINIPILMEQMSGPAPEWIATDAHRLKERFFSDSNSILRFGFAANELEVLPTDVAIADFKLAREVDAHSISFHLLSMGGAQHLPALPGRLKEHGLLGEDLLVVHGGGLSDDELSLFIDHGAPVSTTPETELQMGMGFPVPFRVQELGGTPSLGVDIASNYAGDLFSQMRIMLQSERYRINTSFEKRSVMPGRVNTDAESILDIAIMGGAKAARLDDKVGALVPGKDADIILVRTDSINMAPVNDAVGAIVLYANPSDVDTVMIQGRVVKRNGHLTNVDWPNLRKKLEASRDGIFRRANRVSTSDVEPMWASVFTFDKSMKTPGAT